MKILLLLSLLGLSRAAPLASYDQRQEGELNVKVDLDNFVIVVARPSSGLDLLTGMASLLSDAKRAAAATTHSEDAQPEDDKSKNLDDASPGGEPSESKPKEEEAVLVLVRAAGTGEEGDDDSRSARNLDEEASRAAEESNGWFSSKYKFVDSVDEPQHLKLIGDAIENCGPGRSRDRFGICKQDRND